MNDKQKRWLIAGVIVLLLLILAAIISPWILFPALIVALIAGLLIWGVMSAEATRTRQSQATEIQRPPVPVYQPPAERQYTEGYQAQAPVTPTASWPFTPPPSAEEPQPHEARPGEVYEEPLVQYPE